jgi:threonine synthase
LNQKQPYTKFQYQCINCGLRYDNNEIRYLCPDCESTNTPSLPPKGVLKVIYNYEKLKLSFQELKRNQFLDLLPIQKTESLPNLRIGNTPLYSIDRLNGSPLPFKLFLKDDSQNPTYSFKDRASSLVSAFAKEQAILTIITASTGNAGSSLAGMCAAQNQNAIIILPAAAPFAKLSQSLMYGAKVIRVNGTYDDAFELSIEATKQFGYYNRNTAFNPLTVEGKKTVSYELFEQMGYKIPGRIFVPVGDGVIISGVYKGFEDLMNLGIINQMPVIVAVQSEGSDNLVRNCTGGFIHPKTSDNPEIFKIKPSQTIADSISVDIPRNFYMTQQFIQKYKGEVLTVSDEEIIKASKILSKNTGLFAEPAAAAAFAGLLFYKEKNKLAEKSNNVVLLTGSGLKDLKTVNENLEIPDAIRPDPVELKKALL